VHVVVAVISGVDVDVPVVRTIINGPVVKYFIGCVPVVIIRWRLDVYMRKTDVNGAVCSNVRMVGPCG